MGIYTASNHLLIWRFILAVSQVICLIKIDIKKSFASAKLFFVSAIVCSEKASAFLFEF